jgi:sterol desaturase/sphingolipid hydroxylase (fatty acid hydroxylase superfamily)
VSAPALSASGLRDGVERVFAWTVFPLVVAVTIGGALVLMVRGVDPAAAVLPFLLGGYAFVALMERVFPHQQAWLHSRGDLPADVGLAATNGLLNRLVEPGALAAAAAGGAALSASLGFGLWPGGWPLLAQLPLALVVAELVEYWVHRLMHERDWLWRFHSVHHSAPRLYWLNAVRFHPVDLLLVATGKMLPLALLGCGAPVLALVVLFSAIHGTFQHANLALRLGPLNWIFSMAELHRWHHSPRMEEANHNYGGNLIVWDVVFGTRWLPRDREPPAAIGIETLPRFPTRLGALLAVPFRWARVKREAAAAR